MSIDIPVITTQDIIDSLDINHDMLIPFDVSKYDDWIPVEHQYDGYSDKLTEDIGKYILQYINNNKNNLKMINNDNKISEILNERSKNYTTELIERLALNVDSKIAIVTPYPPDFTGVADFTYETVRQLSKFSKFIDIYTDAKTSEIYIYIIDEIEKIIIITTL